MPFLDGTEYRLLAQRTRAGGPIFWLANEAKARDETFVNKMLIAEMDKMPFYWQAAISRTETLKIKRVPSPNGGHEVHVDHCNPDVTVDEDGRVSISGATLAKVKETVQKVEAAEAGSSEAKAWLKQFDAKATERRQVSVDEPAKKSGCFIATAACGSAYTPEVITLQQFRDSVLMNSRLGRGLIDCYNCISPPLARQIEIRPVAKMLVRTLVIRPVAALIKSRVRRLFDLK